VPPYLLRPAVPPSLFNVSASTSQVLRIILLGRTGNHMFQYALGRVLARKHDVPLVLDASWFNAEGWSEVSHFLKLPLKAKVVRRFSITARALRKLTGKHYWEYRGVPVLRESSDDQSFDPRFLEAPADCVIFGYFQTPLYFESMAGDLRDELTGLLIQGAGAPCPPSIQERISVPTSVAVHVRRGDYLDHPEFLVCDGSYYRSSMDAMRARIDGARFFIFSDAPEWCRIHFNDGDTEVVDSGPAAKNPLHDLRLMSLAGHHIIANSTYSWWAAWIGEKPGQQVVMPGRWYANQTMRAPIEEKRLPRWTLVNTP
jgi:Glycosyl transferase family 11